MDTQEWQPVWYCGFAARTLSPRLGSHPASGFRLEVHGCGIGVPASYTTKAPLEGNHVRAGILRHLGRLQREMPVVSNGMGDSAGEAVSSQAIAPNAFARSIDYMLSKEIIGPQTVLELHDFAEPFLHPRCEDIIVTDDKKKVLAAAPIQTTEDAGQDSRGRRRWQARIDVRHVSPGTQQLHGYALDKTARIAYRLANGVDLE